MNTTLASNATLVADKLSVFELLSPSNITGNGTILFHYQAFSRFLNLFCFILMGVAAKDSDLYVKSSLYSGSRLLTPLGDLLNIPVDQVNFVFSCLVCLILALMMRFLVKPTSVSSRVKALAEGIVGIFILFFCFGTQIRVLFLQAGLSYLMLLIIPNKRTAGVLVTLWAMFCLTLVHLCRLYYDYGGYTLDVSGPVMIQTQRLSSLAFNLLDGSRLVVGQPKRLETPTGRPNGALRSGHVRKPSQDLESRLIPSEPNFSGSEHSSLDSLPTDAPIEMGPVQINGEIINDAPSTTLSIPLPILQKEEEMPPENQENAIEKIPNFLEFFGYLYYFHGACVGPFVFFKDYSDYLRGYSDRKLPPINWFRFVCLVGRIIFTAFATAYLAGLVPLTFMSTPDFVALNMPAKAGYTLVCFFIVRQRYYLAWSLAELIGMSAGHGYSGVDAASGGTVWDKVSNFDFFQVEMASNTKCLIDGWNISTVRWLRVVFYNRAPLWCRTALVFMTSAFWHGMYPGYYLMFGTFALFTFTSRIWRRTLRLKIRVNPVVSCFYDLFTVVITHLAMDYAQAPFHLLECLPSIQYWYYYFFIPHICTITVYLSLCMQSKVRRWCRSCKSCGD